MNANEMAQIKLACLDMAIKCLPPTHEEVMKIAEDFYQWLMKS